MKKLTCMGLSLALMAGLLAGCGSNGTTSCLLYTSRCV